MNKNILIIDNETSFRNKLAEFLKKNNYSVATASTGNNGIKKLKKNTFDIVFLELKLPDVKGLSLLTKIKNIYPSLTVIIITAYGSIEIAIKSIKLGAEDFLVKPINLKFLLSKLKEIFGESNEKNSITINNQTPTKETFSLDDFIGESKVIKELKHNIEKIKPHPDTTILIEGDTGVGKGLLAKIIHYTSLRHNKPFVEINCAAVPDNLLEAELFGYEPGAFTDAKTTKKGLFEIANEGTIFLDEIGDMSLSLQAKLLKVLEDKSIRRLGGLKNIQTNARIIAATNQNLHNKIINKTFRKDLFFRLNILSFYIPPLRQRDRDVLLLADYFIKQFNRNFNKNISGLDDEAKDIFLKYSWPGNVRELRNILQRIFILEDVKVIKKQHLYFYDMLDENIEKNNFISIKNNNFIISLDISNIDLNKIEKKIIEEVLKNTDFNQSKAAKILNITRDILRTKIKKHNIVLKKY